MFSPLQVDMLSERLIMAIQRYITIWIKTHLVKQVQIALHSPSPQPRGNQPQNFCQAPVYKVSTSGAKAAEAFQGIWDPV